MGDVVITIWSLSISQDIFPDTHFRVARLAAKVNFERELLLVDGLCFGGGEVKC